MVLGSGKVKRGRYTLPRLTQPTETTLRRTGVLTPKALGRPKPAVIGTGKVEGIPVYGDTATVTVAPLEIDIWVDPDFFEPLETTTEVTIDVVYFLAHDYFGDGYELIRLEIEDRVAFDTENAAIPQAEFRFYNGLQTTVDPIVSRIVGANAGAHKGDVLIVLPNYPATEAPSVTAVISNSATSSLTANGDLEWTGLVPDFSDGGGAQFHETVGRRAVSRAAFDTTDMMLYQSIDYDWTSAGVAQLATISLEEREEIRRVNLASDIERFVALIDLPGTGFVFGVDWGTPHSYVVVDTITGETLVRTVANEAPGTLDARMPLGDSRYLVGGTTGGGTINIIAAIVDIANKTVEVYEYLPVSFDFSNSSVVAGRSDAGTASIFYTSHSSDNTVYELTYDGSGISVSSVYTPATGSLQGAFYDASTGYLVVPINDSPSYQIDLVDGVTGTLIESVSTPVPLAVNDGTNKLRWIGRANPGHCYLFQETSSGVFLEGKVYNFDIEAQSMFLVIDVDDEYGTTEVERLFFYQSIGGYYYFNPSTFTWGAYASQVALPGTITLEDHITAILTDLGPYEVSQIRFEGFTGISTWGDVIDKDTNIKTVLRSYQDPFGFTWSDIGSEIYFRKPATDGSFLADENLIDTDLVFRAGGSIKTIDETDLTRIARVTLEYVSKDDNYETRTAAADSFSALYEVTRSTKEEVLSTTLILSDVDAEQYVQESLWRLQANARTHQLSTYSDFVNLVPGDVITVPSSTITYTVQVMKVNIKENLQIDFDVRDFQTSLSADVAAVTNTGFSGISTVTSQTQYIHLDIPLYRYADDAGGTALIQYGELASRGQSNWGGGNLYRGDTSTDQSFVIDQAPHVGFIGICTSVLADIPVAHSGDFVNSVTVQRITGDAPTAATEAQALLGTNLAFIGKDGRWEGVGFTTVTDNGGGSYTISGFPVRGYRGSEVYADDHAIGDYFVLIKPEWLLKMGHPVTDLASDKFYRATGIGVSKNTGVLLTHEVSGAAEKPYAVVNAAGELDGGDTDISFDYRSRISAWEMFDVAPDSGEASLAFEIDIFDAGSPDVVVRTIEVSTNAATYTAAQKVTDFGSPPPSALARIYMMSAIVGRGHVAELTIPL